jgi:hypothetical protein
VAGVDYPVGHYTPLDRMIDPTKYSGQGCVFSAAGGRNVLNCSGSGSLRLTGFNFGTPPGAANGVWLHVSGTYSNCTVTDNYFLNGVGSDAPNGMLMGLGPHSCGASLVITDNTFDGNYNLVPTGNLAYLVGAGPSVTTEVFERNALLRSPQKSVALGIHGVVYERFNYFEGLGRQSASHGEFDIFSLGGATIYREYNTALEPSSIPGNTGGITAIFYSSTGRQGSIFAFSDQNNTEVCNLNGGRFGVALCSAMDEYSYDSYMCILIANNWIDATGALPGHALSMLSPATCSAPAKVMGNVNLSTGAKAYNAWGVNTGSGC